MTQIATTIEQSKRLISAGLDPNFADMYYKKVLPKSEKIMHNPVVGNPAEALEWYNKGYTAFGKAPLEMEDFCIPAWSLSRLIDIRGDFNYGPMNKGSEAVMDCIVESMIYLANNFPHRIREYLKK